MSFSICAKEKANNNTVFIQSPQATMAPCRQKYHLPKLNKELLGVRQVYGIYLLSFDRNRANARGGSEVVSKVFRNYWRFKDFNKSNTLSSVML